MQATVTVQESHWPLHGAPCAGLTPFEQSYGGDQLLSWIPSTGVAGGQPARPSQPLMLPMESAEEDSPLTSLSKGIIWAREEWLSERHKSGGPAASAVRQAGSFHRLAEAGLRLCPDDQQHRTSRTRAHGPNSHQPKGRPAPSTRRGSSSWLWLSHQQG